MNEFDLFDDIDLPPRRRWTDLHQERRGVRQRPSLNGHTALAIYEVDCFGCGKKFTVTRRPVPGRRSWCGNCQAIGEPAADRARRYRERKIQEVK